MRKEGVAMSKSSMEQLRYLICRWVRWDPVGTFFVCLQIPVAIALPIVTALVPKLTLHWIALSKEGWRAAFEVGALVFGIFFLRWLQAALAARESAFSKKISASYAAELIDRLLSMPYAALQSHEGRALFARARKFGFEEDQADGAWAAVRLRGLVTSLVGIGSYAALFGRVSPVLLAAVLAAAAVDVLCARRLLKLGNRVTEQMIEGEIEAEYLLGTSMSPAAGRDLRAYGGLSWMEGKLRRLRAAYRAVIGEYQSAAVRMAGIREAVFCLRDMCIFAVLIRQVRAGALSAGDLLFYLGLVLGFSEWLGGMSGDVMSLRRIAIECGYYRAFLAFGGEADRGASTPPRGDIELCGVSFAYDGREVLREIDLRIPEGTSVAVVGENGAGKTTLMKVLCGLYRPSKGEVLYGGTPGASLSQAAIQSSFGAIFQDGFVFPDTVLANVMRDRAGDEATAWDALEKSGLKDVVSALPDGLHTPLSGTDGRGRSLSGGEIQRLLLARAMATGGRYLILDEPTSALDPVREEELYLRFRDATEGKTTFFVSHRLTSTRFCDVIVYLSGGRVAEFGTHEELMQRRGGYWSLYQTQAYFYEEAMSEDRGGATCDKKQ